MTGDLIFWFSEVIWLDNGTIFTHGLWMLQALLQSFNVIIQLEFVIKTSVYMWRLFYQTKTIAIYIWNVATRLNGVAWEFWSRSCLNMGTAQSLIFFFIPLTHFFWYYAWIHILFPPSYHEVALPFQSLPWMFTFSDVLHGSGQICLLWKFPNFQ